MKRSRGSPSVPTIADVARRAGVSPMTVSRVVNDPGRVRPATRATVDRAIADLRYVPNPVARSLASAQRRQIGLLYSNPSAAYLSELLVGTLDEASRRHIHLVVEKCEPGEHELHVALQLIEAGINGVVLPPPLCDSPDLLALLAARDVPTVLVGSGAPTGGCAAVSIDDHAAADEMTRHIVALGHRRIGFIAGAPSLGASARRLDGYRAALAASGLAFDPALVVPGLFTYRSGLDAAERLLDLAEPPTAIFASNDDMAAAGVAVAHRRGIDVPGQLTICGFDDTALAVAIWPELTTVHQPIADMSREALGLLVRMIGDRDAAAADLHHVLSYTLVRRQSDAAPRVRPRQITA